MPRDGRWAYADTDKKNFFLPCIINNGKQASEHERTKTEGIQTHPQGKIKKIFTYSPVCQREKSSGLSGVHNCVRRCVFVTEKRSFITWHISYGLFDAAADIAVVFRFAAVCFVSTSHLPHLFTQRCVQPNKLLQDFVLSYRTRYESLYLIQVIFHLQHH